VGRLGADVDALHDLASSMRAASRQLDDLAPGPGRRARTAGWRGPDADRFQRDWDLRHRPSLAALGERCSRLARELENQADEQRRASASPASARVALRDTALPGLQGTDRLPAPGRGAGAPLTEQRFLGGIEVKVGVVTAKLSGDVAIEQLDDGRVRVTVSETGGLGLAAGVGATATFSVGDHRSGSTPTTGAQADAQVGAAAVERRSWEVEQHAVTGLLTMIAAAEAFALAGPGNAVGPLTGPTSIGAPGTPSAVRAIGRLLDAAVERLSGTDPGVGDRMASLVTIPVPDRVEHLVQVDVAAGAGATLLGRDTPAASAAAAGTLRAGRSVGAAGTSSIVEYSGGLSASLSAALMGQLAVPLPADAGVISGVRLELVEANGDGPARLVAKLSQTTGSTLREVTVRADLGGTPSGPASATLRTALARLAGGDPTGAIAVLSGSTGGADLERVSISTSSAELSGTTVRGGGSITAGAGAGLTVRGQVLQLERQG
jgi:hypothetical protein